MCVPSQGQRGAQVHGGTAVGPVPSFVPSDNISTAVFKYAQSVLPPAILNHSLRVFLIARTLSSSDTFDGDLPSPSTQSIFWASIMHDVGATSTHNGPQRFEVEGADAAAMLLRSHNVAEEEIREVWAAIALHTSAGIAERITPLARLVRLAVLCDFHEPAARKFVDATDLEAAEQEFPRLQIEKILGDTVAEQAVEQRSKAPAASWPGILLRAKLEDPKWDGVNKAF